jgi:hypothetical protein
MKDVDINKEYNPVFGKTYTLFGQNISTEIFYDEIKSLTDELLAITRSPQNLLSIIQRLSSNKKKLEKLFTYPDGSYESTIISTLHKALSKYTFKVSEHLADLSITKKIRDGRLSTSEFQYHLYMIEFELNNRINKEIFFRCEFKYAFLPHCLHDLSKVCKSESDGTDYLCKHCSKFCFINDVSRLLEQQNIKPYIWMESNLKDFIKSHKRKDQSVGILGIACIPELINGMRKCSKANVPVIGIPLDANRCARWFGEFYDNSVNLKILQKLIT